jgi:hypothetical protein
MGRIDHTSPVPPRPPARLLAVLVVLLAVLAGCGGHSSKGSKGGSPSSNPSASTSDKPALDPGSGVAKVGQCFRMTAAQTMASVAAAARVSCRKPHTTVVAYVGYVPQAITPVTSLATRRALATKVCAPAFRALAGGTLADRAQSILTWTFFTPGQTELRRGARWVRCDVVARSGNDLAQLPAVTPFLAHGVPEPLRVCETQTGVEVSCARAHAFRVAGVFRAPGATYPGVSTQIARDRCHQLLQGYGGFFQLPSRQGWTSDDRFVRCLGPIPPQPTPSP